MNQAPSALAREFFSPQSRTEVSALLNESNATAASLEVLRLAECDDSGHTLALHQSSDPPITPSQNESSDKSNFFAKHLPSASSSNLTDPVLQNITNRIAQRIALKKQKDLFKISEKEAEDQRSESESECKSEDLQEFPTVAPPRVQIGPLSNIKEMPTEDSKLEHSYSSSSSEDYSEDESMQIEDFSDEKMLLKDAKELVYPSIRQEVKGAQKQLNFDLEDTPSPQSLRHSEIHMAEPAPVKMSDFSGSQGTLLKPSSDFTLELKPSGEGEKSGVVSDRAQMLEFLLKQKIRKVEIKAVRNWQLQSVRIKAQGKIENALSTVEKMTSFSKTFLALNSLVSFTQRKRAAICSSAFLSLRENQILQQSRNVQLGHCVKIPDRVQKRRAFKAFLSHQVIHTFQEQKRDTGFTSLKTKGILLKMILRRKHESGLKRGFRKWRGEQSSDFEATERICELESTVQKQQKENEELKSILKEYSSWKSKLDQIEQQMKLENEVWKQTAQRVAKENQVYKKQVFLLKEQLQTKQKELSQVQTQLTKGLSTVEEALCSNCHNSLQESQIFKKPLLESPGFTSPGGKISGRTDTGELKEKEAIIKKMELELVTIREQLRSKESEMNEMLKGVQRMERERKMESGKEVLELKEKVKYYEAVEDELKRKVEEQMDVVLKMEEERLIVMKEGEESKERTKKIVEEMEEIKKMMETCGTQLQSLTNENGALKETNANLVAQVQNLKALNQERKEAMKGEESMISPPKSDLKKRLKSSKKPVSKMAAGGWKNLKFENKKRESAGPSVLGTIAAPESDMLQYENTILTNDLISVNREMQKLKIEHRQMTQKVGKIEKERVSLRIDNQNELEKQLNQKCSILERMKRENTDLATALNTDQHKSLRYFESEVRILGERNKQLEEEMERQKQSVKGLESKVEQGKSEIQNLKEERQNMQEKEEAMKRLIGELDNVKETVSTLRGKVAEHEAREVRFQNESRTLKQENSKMKQNVEWLASSARASKLHADKAEKDLQTYMKILRVMESKMEQLEGEKHKREQQLLELRGKVQKLIAQGNF